MTEVSMPGDAEGTLATSAADVAESLRQRIVNGTFEPGQQLKQDALSTLLGVSRTPVREALAILARDGLLLYAAHRGYSVRAFLARDTMQAWEMRREIEAFAVGLCARDGISAADEAMLAECLAKGDPLVAPGPLDMERFGEFRAMNLRFHNTIASASGNPWVTTVLGQLANVPMSSAAMFFDWEDYENVKDAHRDHHRMVEAIAAADIGRARHLMKEHLFLAAGMFEDGYGQAPKSPAVRLPVAARRKSLASPGERVNAVQPSFQARRRRRLSEPPRSPISPRTPGCTGFQLIPAEPSPMSSSRTIRVG